MHYMFLGLIVLFGFYFAPVWTYQRIRTPPVLAKTKGSNTASRFARMHRLNSGNNKDSDKEKGQFWKGLAQLVTMGAGAPSLGEFKEIDEDGKAIFELEANNFKDSEGNVIQTRAKFFENGYVEGSEEDIKAPSFFENLVSGGKAMRDWEERRERE